MADFTETNEFQTRLKEISKRIDNNEFSSEESFKEIRSKILDLTVVEVILSEDFNEQRIKQFANAFHKVLDTKDVALSDRIQVAAMMLAYYLGKI